MVQGQQHRVSSIPAWRSRQQSRRSVRFSDEEGVSSSNGNVEPALLNLHEDEDDNEKSMLAFADALDDQFEKVDRIVDAFSSSLVQLSHCNKSAGNTGAEEGSGTASEAGALTNKDNPKQRAHLLSRVLSHRKNAAGSTGASANALESGGATSNGNPKQRDSVDKDISFNLSPPEKEDELLVQAIEPAAALMVDSNDKDIEPSIPSTKSEEEVFDNKNNDELPAGEEEDVIKTILPEAALKIENSDDSDLEPSSSILPWTFSANHSFNSSSSWWSFFNHNDASDNSNIEKDDNDVIGTLRRDIENILQKAGMALPSFPAFGSENTAPIVKVPTWVQSDGDIDGNEEVKGKTKSNKKKNKKGRKQLALLARSTQAKIATDDSSLTKDHPKKNKKHQQHDGQGQEIVHTSQKVATRGTASSSKTSSDQQEEQEEEKDPKKKACGLGVYVALLCAIALLCVAAYAYRRPDESTQVSSQSFSAIELGGTVPGAEDDDDASSIPSELLLSSPSPSPSEWTSPSTAGPTTRDDNAADNDDIKENIFTAVLGNDGSPASVFPLLRCAADCDNDSECAGELVCFQRDIGEDVPGCSDYGAPEGSNDYCVRPEDINPPALTDPPQSTFPNSDTEISPSPAPSSASSLTTDTTTEPTTAEIKTLVFAAIGDVPYTDWEARKLKEHMNELDETAEFVIHVGDIRSAADGDECVLEEYEEVAEILLRSPVPVFIILGDNDYLDCPNQEEGSEYWRQVFLSFENNWKHNFVVARNPTMQHNFAFEHQSVLFVGLNIPNVERNYPDDWERFLEINFEWARDVVKDYDDRMDGRTGRIVIFSHAMPVDENDAFYDPLEDMFADLDSRHPVLFINGDGHYWDYEDDFRGEETFLRMQVRGEAAEAPTIIRVMATGDEQDVREAFPYHRGDGNYSPAVAASIIGVFVLILTGKFMQSKQRKKQVSAN